MLYSPLFLRFKLSTIITGIRPVDFPFKIFIPGNHTGFQLIHPNHPFFQKIIQNPIIKPHTDRSMSRPAIIVVIVNGSVCYFIAFFTRKFPRKKQMQGRWIKFIQPEKQFHHFGSVTSSGIIEGIKVTQDSTAVSESNMWKPKILRQRLVCLRRSCQYSERFLIEVNCNVDTAIYKWKPTRRTEWKIIVRSPNKK